MSEPACAFCGIPAERSSARPAGAPAARMDVALPACAGCATLEPDRPGAALRAAARLLGADEQDPLLLAELLDAPAALDGLMFADPGDPLRARRAPQAEPWRHVPASTRAALAAALARSRDLATASAPAPAASGPPPSGPPGCLVCGAARSASWRPVTTGALTRGPGYVQGHLCEPCADAHGRVGALGWRLVATAWLRAHGRGASVGLVEAAPDLAAAAGLPPGLVAWVATGLPPGEPWAWVEPPAPGADPLQGEVAALRAEVRALRAGAAS